MNNIVKDSNYSRKLCKSQAGIKRSLFANFVYICQKKVQVQDMT